MIVHYNESSSEENLLRWVHGYTNALKQLYLSSPLSLCLLKNAGLNPKHCDLQLELTSVDPLPKLLKAFSSNLKKQPKNKG